MSYSLAFVMSKHSQMTDEGVSNLIRILKWKSWTGKAKVKFLWSLVVIAIQLLFAKRVKK